MAQLVKNLPAMWETEFDKQITNICMHGEAKCFWLDSSNQSRPEWKLPDRWKWNRKLLSRVWHFATPWTIQSMKFSGPECRSGYPFPSPGDFPNPGIKPKYPTFQADSLWSEPPNCLNTDKAPHSPIPRDLIYWRSSLHFYSGQRQDKICQIHTLSNICI